MIEKLNWEKSSWIDTINKINEIIDHLPQEKDELIDPVEPIVTCEHGRKVTHLKGCQCVVCKRERINIDRIGQTIKEDISINKIIGNEPTQEKDYNCLLCFYKDQCDIRGQGEGHCASYKPTKEVPDIQLTINCDFCKEKLIEQGALIFSPPNKEGKVNKIHMCKKCYYNYSLQEISVLYRKEIR